MFLRSVNVVRVHSAHVTMLSSDSVVMMKRLLCRLSCRTVVSKDSL